MFTKGSEQVSEDYATTVSPQGSEKTKTAAKSSDQSSQPRIRRRNRLITSCLECRRRKLKCDKLQPCTNCTRFNRDCLFLAPALDQESQQRLAEIKEKMGSLEKTLEQDVARKKGAKSHDATTGHHLPGQGQESDEESTPPEDEQDLQINTFALQDIAYGGEPDDDLVDLGIQIGRMRITDRVGGYFRPKVYEEMADAFKGIPGINTNDIPSLARTEPSQRQGSEYVAPASGFFFAPPVRKNQHLNFMDAALSQPAFGQVSLMQYLPMKSMSDKLMSQYWTAVHPICRVVHKPTFERSYEAFWRDVTLGKTRNSFMALLFSALFSAIVSMPPDAVYDTYAVEKKKLLDNFREGTELALSNANFLRTTKLETLQGFVAYLIPLCRSEVSRAHAALTGTAIRLAECMGLHRDGSNFQLSAVEVHVRRLVWYQLCFLDLRTCEACGPRPQIRMDDFDTQMPLNVNDDELELAQPPIEDSDKFTDATVARLRFECNEMHRLFWFERAKLGKGKLSITSLLAKGEKFKAAMEKKYYPMFDFRIPLHFEALQIYRVLTGRLHSMLLHRYASNSTRMMPDRLRNTMMSSVTVVMEHAIAMETNPAISTWSWYTGAFQQWHVALLIMGELYAKPPPKAEEERIWRCLDYAFELPPHLSYAEKGRIVLGDLKGKTELYQRLHHIHLPKANSQDAEKLINALDQNSRRLSSSPQATPSPPPAPPPTRSTQNMQAPSIMSVVENNSTVPFQTGPLPLTSTNSTMFTPEYQHNFLPGGLEDTYYAPPTSRPGAVQSPSSSDTSGNTAGGQIPGESQPQDLMVDIDWNEWDKIFPPENTARPNELNIPTYTYPEYMGGNMNWQNGPGL